MFMPIVLLKTGFKTRLIPMAAVRYRRFLLVALLLIGAVAACLSMMLGPVTLGSDRLLAAWQGQDETARTILMELRLPRTLIGLIVGAILGAAGAALQGFLRNPLAEPSVLGTSNAAALGAVAALYFGLTEWHPALLPAMAIGCAILSLALLLYLGGKGESALSLILAGIAVGTLAGAAISLSLNLSENPFAAMEIMTWLMGSLENRSFDHFFIALPCVTLGLILILWDGRALDALTLGEDGAKSLGVDLARTKYRLLAAVAIGVGGAVAVSGAIGFVGLIVPHLLRPLTNKKPSEILLPSAIGGAVLLTMADVAVRIIPTDNELKLGVVTAFLGVPFFLIHLMRARRLLSGI
jgi:iron complex transport system permease protein